MIDFQHTCAKFNSLLEVTSGMKEIINEKVRKSNNNDVPVMKELVPTFRTLKITLSTPIKFLPINHNSCMITNH